MINKKLKIILVEDSKPDRILLERQIRKIVAEPIFMRSSILAEVKDLITTFEPDIVLSDYNLVTFTGLEVLQFIKSVKRNIPLIFVTGTINNEELAASTILTGADGYILKNNINQLHKKLLPYFEKIVKDQEKEKITSEHSEVFADMEIFLHNLRSEDQMIRASFREMKRALEMMKSLE